MLTNLLIENEFLLYIEFQRNEIGNRMDALKSEFILYFNVFFPLLRLLRGNIERAVSNTNLP